MAFARYPPFDGSFGVLVRTKQTRIGRTGLTVFTQPRQRHTEIEQIGRRLLGIGKFLKSFGLTQVKPLKFVKQRLLLLVHTAFAFSFR